MKEELKNKIHDIGIKKQFIAMKVNITPFEFSRWLSGTIELPERDVKRIYDLVDRIEKALKSY